MDPLALIVLQGTCKTSDQYDFFDMLFHSYFPDDPDGQLRKVFDVLKAGKKLLIYLYDVMYLFAYGWKQENDELETVAAMAA